MSSAATLLAEVIAAIGVAAFIALVTHAAGKASKGAIKAKKENVRRTPPSKMPMPS